MLVRRLLAVVALSLTAVVALARVGGHDAAAAPGVTAQAPTNTVIVSIYRIAPGKQLEFLKWMAAQDAIAREAGLPASQFYAHMEGDSWDYVSIRPATSPQQDQRTDSIARQRGRATGVAASLEVRQYFASHTDTYARGPFTAAQLVAMAERK